MGRWWQVAAAAVVGILLGAAAMMFFGGNTRFAMVDMDRIMAESKTGKDLQSKLNQRQAVIVAELNKITNAQQKAAKNQEYLRELTSTQQEYSKQVVALADPIIAKAAKRHHVKAVYTKGTLAVRYAELDLTDEVIKGMNQ